MEIDISRYEAGPELDEIMAEVVMEEARPTENLGPLRGIMDQPLSLGGCWAFHRIYEHGDVPEWLPLPFSTTMYAWKIVERLIEQGYGFSIGYFPGERVSLWDASFYSFDDIPIAVQSGDTAPLAICRAAYSSHKKGREMIKDAAERIAEAREEIRAAVLEEAKARDQVHKAARQLRIIEVQIVQAGYQDGKIKGKNAETRKREADLLLDASEVYHAARQVLTVEEMKLAERTADLESTREFYKMWRAHWYSLGGRV